jgi:hypothetical protein
MNSRRNTSKRKTTIKSIKKTSRKSLRKTPKEMKKKMMDDFNNKVRITNKTMLEQQKMSKKNVDKIIEDIKNEKEDIKTLIKDIKIKKEKKELSDFHKTLVDRKNAMFINKSTFIQNLTGKSYSQLIKNNKKDMDYVIKAILNSEEKFNNKIPTKYDIHKVLKKINYYKYYPEEKKKFYLPADIAEGSRRKRKKSKQNKKKNNKRTQNKRKKTQNKKKKGKKTRGGKSRHRR